MKFKLLRIFFIAGVIGCASASSSKIAGQGFLSGADNSKLRLLIRTINEGEILWVGNYKLGTQSPIEVGSKKVSVMCEFFYSWGTKMMPGEITIDIKADVTYKLNGTPSADDKTCVISANT